MKNLLLIVLAVSLIVVFTACGNVKPDGQANLPSDSTADKKNVQSEILDNASSVVPDVASDFASNTVSSSDASAKSDKVSLEEAKSIALKAAGFNAKDVKFLRAELDHDDGVLKYEVDFSKDGFEYDYDIDAYSGKILDFEKDKEDFD